MMILLVSIDAKYIHTNLAVRYLKANSDFPVVIKEFTIKDDYQKILDSLVSLRPDVIGFSVYIWNVKIIKRLTSAIKDQIRTTIVWGGPEVSYEYDKCFKEAPVDYIIAGEGELAFNQLLHALEANQGLDLVPGLIYRENGNIIANKKRTIRDLSIIKDPYRLKEYQADIPHKIQYLELSRGCPFQCSYCLASLDNSVRYFPLSRVTATIDYLLSKGAKTFKFLDRTFNAKESLAREMLAYVANLEALDISFQFEITGDILSDDFVEFVRRMPTKNRIRFEIGIQSLNDEANILVHRRQDNKRLFSSIKKIQASENVDLHLDLIAGLPGEDLQSFERTFNETVSLFPKELQLGVLKLLKGTLLRQESDKHRYIYNEQPPYEISGSKYLSTSDMKKILLVEKMLNIYYNKGFMPNAIKWVLSNIASPFMFLLSLSEDWLKEGFGFSRYQLVDIFARFNEYIDKHYPEISSESFALLKLDYLRYHKLKPKIWWKQIANKNEIIRSFFDTNQTYPLEYLYKHAVVATYQDHYLIAVYGGIEPSIIHYS
ncbi:MAG: DUF4080 domain-containing protein [Candidatus Izemoplasmatales bacterium]|jgi:radical SAM superfamily enzyme YgiQ (UPF0313 family)